MRSNNTPLGPVNKGPNKHAIARVFGVKNTEVTYLKEGVDLLDFKVLYDPATQLCFWKGDATGVVNTWSISGDILGINTSNGVFSLSQAKGGDWLKTMLADVTGASLVTMASGKTVENVLANIVAALGYVTPEMFTGTDTEQLLAANNYALTNSVNFVLQANKTYALTGTTGLNIDLAKMSFGAIFGRARIDATGFTGDGAIWIHSSATYPNVGPNHTNSMRGVEIFGSIVSGQAGWVLGNKNSDANGTYNGDCHVYDCVVRNFDIRILFTNSTWRYKFYSCGITNTAVGTYTLYAPSGLSDSGESISFIQCKFYDNKGNPILVALSYCAISFVGSSILNTPISVTGTGSHLSLSGMGNMENPNQQSWYRYVSVTGVGAKFSFNSATIICNQPTAQTKPLFYIGTNAYMHFGDVRLTGNAYPFEGGDDLIRSWCEGPGYITESGCTIDPTSGVGARPLHKSISPIYNFSFETGTTAGWTVNASGSASQTAVVSADSAKAGTYGVRITSISTLSCFLTQRFVVTPGQTITMSAWAKILTAGVNGNSAGAITVTYYTKSGEQISSQGSNLPSAVTDWAVYASFVMGKIPVGAAEAVVSLSAKEGAVVDYDAILINLLG
ncbi:tail protein [Klebsiella phage vB_KpP_FBKp27]|uniref:Tail fiber family protein n=1 Tax=Klebsiella phage vB_KpP_FBKp27 TaxID=2801837 RepID=A0A7U0GAG5_9CAUD|nr:tail protein [Klebsiella phage vB_KpP_FBKp27]QQV91607.1 tail fiber family protein [Klebsiella phage vB_KpP_FBKp27]